MKVYKTTPFPFSDKTLQHFTASEAEPFYHKLFLLSKAQHRNKI